MADKKTVSQMKADSQKATEEGLKAIAKALAVKIMDSSDSESESGNESDSRSESGSNPSGGSKHKCKKYETIIHYMKLDLANKELELIELKNEVDRLSLQEYELKQLNKLIHELHGVKLGIISDKQRAMTLFTEDSKWYKHKINLENIVKLIDADLYNYDNYSSITSYLIEAYETDKKVCVNHLLDISNHILYNQLKCLMYFTIIILIVIILIVRMYNNFMNSY